MPKLIGISNNHINDLLTNKHSKQKIKIKIYTLFLKAKTFQPLNYSLIVYGFVAFVVLDMVDAACFCGAAVLCFVGKFALVLAKSLLSSLF